MVARNSPSIRSVITYFALGALVACGKDKQKVTGGGVDTDPPIVTKACQLTGYSTTEDLGGNGSSFSFSYDKDFNLNKVTGTTLQGYQGVTVSIGAEGVKRDNGASLVSWNYNVDVYTSNPGGANYEVAAGLTPIKLIESYKYDTKNRLYEVDEFDATTNSDAANVYYTYDDNDNCTSITYASGNTKVLQVYYATKYDDHPNPYSNINNHRFMHWIESAWGGSSNPKYGFDMVSAHNILEWTSGIYDASSGIKTGTLTSTFAYTYDASTGMPESRTETATQVYNGNTTTNGFTETFTYTGCD